MPIFKVEMLDDLGATVHIAAAYISDADSIRFFGAYKSIYNVPEISDDDMFRLFATGLIQGAIANVRNFEVEEATRQIESNVINFTPLAPPTIDFESVLQGVESASGVIGIQQVDVQNDVG